MIPLKQVWPPERAALYRQKGYWGGETFSQMLRDRASEQPDAVAVVDEQRRWTYAELLAEADRVAAGFLALGLQPGDRVVVQLPNTIQFLGVIFGLFRARLVPVYALPAHRLIEIAHFARKSEAAAYVIADRREGFDYRQLAREVLREVPAIRHVVVDGDAEEFTTLDSFVADPALLPTDDADPSVVAFLQISGGSTGLSKLIPRTHDDYLYSVRESALICGLKPESVYLTALPAAHNFPMSSPGYLGALYVGATVVMAASPSPDACFPLIEREGVTVTGLVPPLALLWMQAAAKTPHDISSLQVLLVGGAKFLPEAAKRVRAELGCTLQQVFGMAEGLVNYTRLDDPDALIVETQGRPISEHDEILIVDDSGNPVPEGEPGHLLTRGPYTINAYHDDPAANARSFTEDGYYRTGDVVRRTPEGYLVVMGRATDHINRAGEKISAEEVEDYLLAHPEVFDAAVVSVPDDYLGERTCAFIIPAEGTSPRGVAIKAWMRKRDVAEFKVPDQIVFVEDFAVTAVGKISRRELRAALRARLLDAQEATA